MSDLNYKYKFRFGNDDYIGNSVDEIANKIIKGNPDITFSKAVAIVNAGIIPVYHRKQEKRVKEVNIPVSILEMQAGAKSALKQISGDTVSQSEINRRSNNCSNCPKISEVSFCKACGQAAALVRFANKIKNFFGGGIRIPFGLERNYCSCCDCSLAMLLPAPLSHIKDSTKNDPERPASCWMKQ